MGARQASSVSWENVSHPIGGHGRSRERNTFRTEARSLGARVELYFLSAPLEELFARIQQRNMEDPAIEWTEVQKWADIFEAPTSAERALFDTPSWKY